MGKLADLCNVSEHPVGPATEPNPDAPDSARLARPFECNNPWMQMIPPAGWQNPITVAPGQVQTGVDARLLLPGRHDLERVRLEFQRSLQQSGRRRYTPIEVTRGGVIWDGHHAARVAAEAGATVDVVVIAADAPPTAASILDLPVR